MLRAVWFAPCVVFVLTLAMRLIVAGCTLIGWDEWILATIVSRLGLWAIPEGRLYDILVPTGYSYPPFFFWIGGLLVYLFDASPLVWRLPTVLSEAAAAAAVCLLGRRLGGRIGEWTAGLLAVATLYLSFHDTVTLDFLLSFWIVLSVYFLLRAQDERRVLFAVLSVFAGSLAVFTKYHGVVYLGPLCILIALHPKTGWMLRGRRVVWFAAAAGVLPALMLAIEGLTWRYYGFEKTHIAEVLRVMTWTSHVQDPYTGRFVIPQWHYYLVYCWALLGPLVCGLCVFAGITAIRRRDPRAMLVLGFVLLWFVWASTGSLKNARYVLPAVYLSYALAGLPLQAWARRSGGGRAALVVISLAVGLGALHTGERIAAYRAQAAWHGRVHRLVDEELPDNALVVSDSLVFQTATRTSISPMKRPVADPPFFAEADITHVITVEEAYDFLQVLGNPANRPYLEARERIVAEWRLLLDVGEAEKRIRVFERPAGPETAPAPAALPAARRSPAEM